MSSPRVVMGAAALAVVALITFVTVRCTPERDDGARPLWRLRGHELSGPDRYLDSTSWVAGPVLAITRPKDVTGYDTATGKVRWRVPLSGSVCQSSALPAKGRVAVQFGRDPRSDCGRVAVVDLNTGAKVWESQIASAEPVRKGQVVIGGDAVVVRWSKGVAAFGLADGRPRWSAPSSRRRCAVTALAGGPVLVASYECVSPSGRIRHVRGLAPSTGRPAWSYAVPAGQEVDALPSSSPVVALLRPENLRATTRRLVVLSAKGVPRADIPLTNQFAVRCEALDPSRCEGIVVHGDTIYTRPHTGPKLSAMPVVALSADGGRARWSATGPRRNELIPIAMEDGGKRLIAAQPQVIGRRRTSPPQLVAVDVADGRTTVLRQLDRKGATNLRLTTTADRHYAQGRLFLVNAPTIRGTDDAVIVYGG